MENLPEESDKDHKVKRILYIPVEFQTWDRAKHLSYSAYLGLEEGLKSFNVEVTTLPANILYSPGESTGSHPGYWLDSLATLCAGQSFDQIWVEIVHSHLSEEMLNTISQLAPIRIALIGESLEYVESVCAIYPHLASRKNLVLQRLRAFTHALVSDEKDALELNGRGEVNALWMPASIPERFIGPDGLESPVGKTYYPSSDLELSPWMNQSKYAGRLFPQPGLDQDQSLAKDFDAMHANLARAVLPGKATWEQVRAYLDPLRAIRAQSFKLHLESLAKSSGIVNLPTYFQGYGNTLFATIAAMRPVISWDIPNRPRNRSMFQDGDDILLYPGKNPDKLLVHLDALSANPAMGARLARKAVKKLWRFHTTEKRVSQIFSWIETGSKPIFEEMDFSPSIGVSMQGYWKTFPESPKSGSEPVPTATAPKTASPIPDAYSVQLNRAESYLGEKSFKKASEAFLNLVQSRPNDIELWLKLAFACLADNNSSMAQRALEGVLALDVNHVEARTLLYDIKARQPQSGSSGNLLKADIDRYYEKFFLQSPEYANQMPNPEEMVRWQKIETFLRSSRDDWAAQGKGALRILDLGCGRGWLTNQASNYGTAEGMEPVSGVIIGARKLFPKLTFYACEAAQLRKDPAFRPYNLILNSEVIEHVPWSHKEAFVDALKSLLTPNGTVILTTPRGEVFDEYMRLVNYQGQPIEDWTTELQTRELFTKRGFSSEGPQRIWAKFPECVYYPTATPEQEKSHGLMAIYQVWRFKLV